MLRHGFSTFYFLEFPSDFPWPSLPEKPTPRTFAFNFFGIKQKLVYIF
jgi:hypothetical protein